MLVLQYHAGEPQDDVQGAGECLASRNSQSASFIYVNVFVNALVNAPFLHSWCTLVNSRVLSFTPRWSWGSVLMGAVKVCLPRFGIKVFVPWTNFAQGVVCMMCSDVCSETFSAPKSLRSWDRLCVSYQYLLPSVSCCWAQFISISPPCC